VDPTLPVEFEIAAATGFDLTNAAVINEWSDRARSLSHS
jgi:hypothetical protein